MSNVVFISYVREHGKYYWGPRQGSRRFVRESKPWDGSNRPKPVSDSHMKDLRANNEHRFLTDRERVARDQPSKAKAQSMGTKKRGQ